MSMNYGLIGQDNQLTPWEHNLLNLIDDRGGMTDSEWERMCRARGINQALANQALNRWLEMDLVWRGLKTGKLLVNQEMRASVIVMTRQQHERYLMSAGRSGLRPA